MRSNLFYLMLVIPSLVFYSKNVGLSIDYRSFKSADSMPTDTMDVGSIFLSFRYRIDELDTAKSSKLLQEQREFLMQYNLPIDGLEEIKNPSKYDYVTLSQGYDVTVKKLWNHPFRDLYRQVCSQVLIKRICSQKSTKIPSLQFGSSRLRFFLGEMMDSEGINIVLIYASCLKLQSINKDSSLCQDYKSWLAYGEKILAIHKSEVRSMEIQNRYQSDELDSFILSDQKNRLDVDGEYLHKIKAATDEVCRIK